jgi:glutamate 5-kinase
MKRLVLKVGSHVLTQQNRLARDRIENLCILISKLNNKGYEVILVSSGAVAAGYSKIKLDKSILANRQALSAIGQPHLMGVYEKKLSQYDITTAQVLLTADDFDSRKATDHAKNAIEALLENGVLPIINENDTTATQELVFGDNDQLSAHVAYYFDADMLVILSDIDGYYTKDPRKYSDAALRSVVHSIEPSDLESAETPNHAFATGGIVTKLKSADFLLKRNREMFLASGFDLSDIESFLLYNSHQGGTHFTT